MIVALALIAAALAGVHVGWSTTPEARRLREDVTDLAQANTDICAEVETWRERACAAADRLEQRVAADIARRPAHDARGRFTRKT